MIKYSIFIIDDEESLARAIALNLQDEYQVSSFLDGESALAALQDEQPDLILLDIGLPGISGVEVLGEIKGRFPEILVLMITAYEEIETVITTLRNGAYDYIVKPLQMDALRVSIRNALETIQLRKEVRLLQKQYCAENIPLFIGESNVIKRVMDLVVHVAKSPDTPVIVEGESGTGKELIANAIHCYSPNFQGPIVALNCAAIPHNLLESELFGYEKGAFTGAESQGKQGLVEQAENGTLFLDEIGDLSLEAQAKLLRFIETGEFYRVGGTKKHRVRTRIISATNKNLESMIEQGDFREDLYFRISVIQIKVPPLRERQEDIVPIAKHFLDKYSRKFGKVFTCLTDEAAKLLETMEWNGNIRELKNYMERVALTSENQEVTARDLVSKYAQIPRHGGTRMKDVLSAIPNNGIDLDILLDGHEKYYIEEALKLTGGNETKAARMLNIKYSTLRYRRRKYHIP